MSSSSAEEGSLTKPKLVLVEGKEDEVFFCALRRELTLDTEIQIRAIQGKQKLRGSLLAVHSDSGFHQLTALGVVRDADQDSSQAFQSVADALRLTDFSVPGRPLEQAGDRPRVTVMILPVGKESGMLEDVCLTSVADDLAMHCVDEYFACLARVMPRLPQNPSKAVVRAFLTSRELIEDSHFEYLQREISEWLPSMSDQMSVERVHAFLASRYRPTLDLGTAAGAGYWNLNHPVFDAMKGFLREL